MAQVLAHEAELARLEWLGRWQESRMRANALAESMRDAASLNRETLRDGLLFRIPSFYKGN